MLQTESGHFAFLSAPLDLERAVRCTIATRRAATTSTIQPPLLAWAWTTMVDDPGKAPRIHGCHDLEGDTLLWLISPDVMGLDASPKFDHVGHLRARIVPAGPWFGVSGWLAGIGGTRVGLPG